MEDFKDSVRRGFSACKSDIESLNQENNELKGKINSLENDNSKLQSELSDIKSELKSIANILNEIKSQKTEVITSEQPISQQVQVRSDQIPVNVVSNEQNIISERKKTRQPTRSDDPYEALLAFKAKVNKREMLKSKIVSMVNENGINLSELKFMFVEHYRYCSKATFYNYLKELELERIIKIERENSKNFVYLSSMKREI